MTILKHLSDNTGRRPREMERASSTSFEQADKRLETVASDVSRFIDKTKRYSFIPELTSEILRMFINKIIVHEKAEKYSRTAEKRIEIPYAHIGMMGNAQESTQTELTA